MTTMSDLHDYELTTNQGKVLGLVTFYSVRDTLIPHDELVAVLKDHDLQGFAPKPPADSDVFRRVCTGAQRKRQDTDQPQVYENILVRDVTTGGSDQLLKRIVSETVDPKGRRLSYAPQYDVKFNRDSSRLNVRRISGAPASRAADEVAQQIVRDFPAQVGCVNGAAIRDLLNRAITGSDAVSIRDGGGVYFVPSSRTAVVEGLEALAHLIDGTSVHSIPLPDNKKQRDMLRSSVEFEAAEEIERTMTEIRGLLTGADTVTADRASSFLTRYRQLKGKAEQYAQMLETTLGTTTASLDILQKQVRALAIKAEG